MWTACVSEIWNAELKVIKIAQQAAFHDEIRGLKAKKNVSKNSKLISLYPFLDEHDAIRVGGRLEKSSLPYDQMHPMVLPKENAITDFIAKHIHIKSLHAGPQLLLSNIR